jgi:hypothetical protein
MTMNQTIMTGPNIPPTKEVPLRWIANNSTRIAAVRGTTT